MTHNPLIVALDVASVDEARALVGRIGEHAKTYKVGMELYAVAGMAFVHELLAGEKEVFLDLKLYDIPETVKRAVAHLASTGIRFLTVHAVRSVMQAAVEGRGNSDLNLLAVTVLTSFTREDLADLGYACDVLDVVERRARQASEAGVQGVVCSPHETAMVRSVVGPGRLIVTPGVRSAGIAKGDQKRVATPVEAIRAGADYLVMGRQITRAADPAAEAQRVLEEIAAA